MPLPNRVTIPPKVMFRDIDGEALILELATGQYFGLDEVGTRMWRRLEEHGEVEAACQALLRDFQVSEDELRRDLLEFIDQLASRKLIELQG